MAKKIDETTGLRPWSRRRKESPEAHQAYLRYQDMGTYRSGAKLCAEHGYGPQTIAKWMGRWSWTDRAEAYDTHVACVEQRGKDEVIARRAAEWERRREETREAAYLLSQGLLDRVAEMLRHPITTKRIDKETGQVIVKPVRWNHGNLATMAGLAVEMAKGAIDDALPPKPEDNEIKVSIDFEAAVTKVYGDESDEDLSEKDVQIPYKEPDPMGQVE